MALGLAPGVFIWALLWALGISALVAASEAAFVVLKVVGGAALVRGGSRRPGRGGAPPSATGWPRDLPTPSSPCSSWHCSRSYVPEGSSVLPAALGMAVLVVAFDLVWFSLLALFVERTRRALVGSALARRIERLVRAVLIGLGVRVALEQR